MNNEGHFELTDEEFENKFADSSLAPTSFSHEAHIRLAWIHISKYGEIKAILNITEQLKRFVQLLGAQSKYNETLTIAAIMVVNHFMENNEYKTFKEFIINNQRLKYEFKELINAHYSFDIFNSIEAKQKYIEPDLLAF
jgi:hypothetical protein